MASSLELRVHRVPEGSTLASPAMFLKLKILQAHPPLHEVSCETQAVREPWIRLHITESPWCCGKTSKSAAGARLHPCLGVDLMTLSALSITGFLGLLSPFFFKNRKGEVWAKGAVLLQNPNESKARRRSCKPGAYRVQGENKSLSSQDCNYKGFT